MKALLTIAIVITGVAVGQEVETTRCTTSESCSLQGKPKVTVLVERLHEDLRRAGLFEQQLQTEAVLLLRKFDVPVIALGSSEGVLLYIQITGREMKIDGQRLETYYCSARYEARQTVRLYRNPSIVILDAATWITDAQRSGYMTSRKSLRNAITNSVQQDTKEFINAYLEANPQ